MNTDNFTRLIPPQQAQVKIDPKECSSEGFNYPSFRLLNKQERVKLSARPFEPGPTTFYDLLAVANSRGWFAAVTVQDDGNYAIICSPLVDLRATFRNAKEGDGIFMPKRTVSLQSQKPSIIAFASNDTRLFVSLERGDLLVYDTATLFSAGSDAMAPIHQLPSETGSIRHIVPNPGTEPNLVDLVAVVRSNKTVVLYNSKLEVEGGWISSEADAENTPVAIAWSPKGKHIAIGLQAGHIMTYPLTNKSSLHKHVPPTARPPLVSLNWLSPGHTFRTSYAPSLVAMDSTQHIICVDAKAPTATYYAPNHPFPLPDRHNQSFTVILPRWDEDAGSTESKSLVVVGDKVSVDLEVLGNVGAQWYQQSQENPLSLPLDGNQEDTLILGLEADLTDVETSTPIMYACLNDGTVQGWYMEYTKPYSGMVTPQSVAAFAPSAFGQPAPPTQQPAFGQSAFGQSSFGQPSAFGQPQAAATVGTSSFGQTSSTSAFGGGAPAFGQTQTISAFGQPATTSAFGGGSAAGAFGSGLTTGAFGGVSTTNAFGGGAFGSSATNNTFGGGAFGGLANNGGNKNAFGQATFGFGTPPPIPATVPVPALEMTREASMSDDTPSFGGLGLGEPNDPSKPMKSGGIFGALPPAASSATTTSLFGGGTIKPATGFGAFSNYQAPAISTASEQQSSSNQPSTSAFGATTKPASGFGQPSSFGTSSFGQPSFGQSTFGNAVTPPSTTSAVSGGFSVFASAAPTSFSGAAAHQTGSAFGSSTAPSTGGFGAFSSTSPSAFGAATTIQAPSPPATGGGFGAFASGTSAFGTATPQAATTTSPFTSSSPPPKSPFAPGGTTASAFGTPELGVSPFGPQPGARAKSPFEKEPSPTLKTPGRPTTLGGSPPSSPESTPRLGATIVSDNESPPPALPYKPSTTPATSPFGSPFGRIVAPSSGAFGNIQTSPSVFKPASGFGAFGSDTAPTSSPFFKAPAEPKTPPVLAFHSALATPPGGTAPAANASPAFGSSSSLGGVRSAFAPAAAPPTPAKVPAVGGFGTFSGSSAAFGAFAGPKKSFGELLKTGDGDADPVKPKTGKAFELPKEEDKKVVSAFPPIIAKGGPSVFSPPPKEETAEKEVEESPTTPPHDGKEKRKKEDSLESLSLLSDASSFAEVDIEETDEHDIPSGSEEDADGEAHVEYDEEGSFLSEDEESSLSESEGVSPQLSDVPEEEEEEEEEEEKEPRLTSREPTAVPLPKSRSTSATPQPDLPKIHITPSPPPEIPSQKVREESTTPPGTPTKEYAAPLARPPSAPPTTTPSTSFGIGLGRPSTRPTRSSPLASVPVSLADEEEPSPMKPPASPQPRYSPLPVHREIPMKDEEDETPGGKPPRPQTPPLLSSFGPKKSDVAPTTPATPPSPVLPPAVPPSTTPATPTFSLLGKFKPPTPGTPSTTETVTPPPGTPAASLPGGIFGKPATATASMGFGYFDGQPAQSLPGAKSAFPPVTQPAPFDLSGFGLKGKAAEPTSPLSPPTSQALSPAAAPNVPATAGTVLFGTTQVSAAPSAKETASSFFPSTTPSATPGTPAAAFDLSGLGLKGKGGAAAPPSQAPATPPPFDLSGISFKGKAPPAGPPELPQPQPLALPVPSEAGMQRECVVVVNAVNDDLASLGRLAEQHKMHLEKIKARTGGRQREDLFDLKKWSPAGAALFGQVLVQFEKDLDELKDARDAQRQTLREIQGSMLKAGTRKEEISRFNKAKDDKDFARMLKARTLGPEHLETQTQLRRNIRIMRDRIQKLEDHLKEAKKKLSQVKTGRPGLRAPSLDTINRTYRNIDLAIQQQLTEVTQLKKRISKLRVSTPSSSSPSRDARLPDPVSRPYNVTPHVAVTTAAALNAERSAHKLKRALLAVRTEPILNTRAATAPAPPLSFGSPQKPGGDFFRIPPATPLFAAPPQTAPAPEWSLPQDNFSPSPPAATGRRGAGVGVKKHNVIPLRKGTGSPTPAAAPSFNWGPLPTFDFDTSESFSMVEAVKLTSTGGAR